MIFNHSHLCRYRKRMGEIRDSAFFLKKNILMRYSQICAKYLKNEFHVDFMSIFFIWISCGLIWFFLRIFFRPWYAKGSVFRSSLITIGMGKISLSLLQTRPEEVKIDEMLKILRLLVLNSPYPFCMWVEIFR